MKALKFNGLYVLDGSMVQGEVSINENLSETIPWHKRLGYISDKRLIELDKQGFLHCHKVEKLDFCDHCIFVKQIRVKLNIVIHQTKRTLDYIHFNV